MPPSCDESVLVIMGSLFIEIGQCGCQIGMQLNPKLSGSYYATRTRAPNRLHAIMLDTEPKVLQPLLALQPKWLDPLNVRFFQYGRGNNWSYGYLHDLPAKKNYEEILPKYRQHSHMQLSPVTMERYVEENKSIWEFVLERVRRELETVDCAMAVNVIGSLGGGTGSGLGTKIVEKLHDEINLDILGHFVLPNKSGETPLQAYNCVLSLASLQEHCSAIFTYENDKYMTLFRNMEQKETSIDDINSHLSHNIARFIQLNDVPKFGRFYSSIASDCVLSPQLKYLNLFSTDSKKADWEDALSTLNDELRNYQNDGYGQQFGRKDQRECLLHGELLLLGKEPSLFQQKFQKKMRNILNPLYADSLVVEQVRTAGKEKQEKCSAILVANHSNILNYLQYLLQSGLSKFQAKAYLWHYQYADLQLAFDSLQNVVNQYYYTAHE